LTTTEAQATISSRWTPASPTRSGDLGYTYAELQVDLDGPDGEPIAEVLRDFHVWAKDADGAWRVVVDIWNSPDPLPRGGN